MGDDWRIRKVSGILECIGTWLPIPGQLIGCNADIVKNILPLIADLGTRAMNIGQAACDAISGAGK
jgi:hypothetical protein